MRKAVLFLAIIVLCFMFSGTRLYAEETVGLSEGVQNEITDSIIMQEKVQDVQNNTSVSASAEKSIGITGKIEISEINLQQGKFIVRAFDLVDAYLIQDIRFAVWSEVGGQDDLLWTVVSQDENGSYYMEVNVADHKYSLGTYLVDVYAVLTSGEQVEIGSAQCSMNIESSNLEISEGSTDGQYSFLQKTLTVPGEEEAVLFAVWSEKNGQDDLIWYDAEKKADGSYQYEWSVKNHKGLGKYNVHTYVKTKTGVMNFIGSYQFDIDTPQINGLEIDTNISDGRINVHIDNISNPGLIKEILLPVWSEGGGQDDLIWYRAQRTTDGKYELKVDIKDHKYTDGEYNVHVYIMDITGCQYFAGSETCTLPLDKGTLKIDKISDKKYMIELQDLVVPGGVSDVMFPVWSESEGQDDLIWYEAEKDKNGSFSYTLDLSKHKGLGTYNVHAYVKKRNGNQVFLLRAEFKTDTPAVDCFDVNAEDRTEGCFTVTVSDIVNADLVKSIRIPVWSKPDQSDLIWYNASKNLKGEYSVEVNIKNHNYNAAVYNVHCYIEDITGGLSGVGTTSCDMSAKINSLNVEDKDGTEQSYIVSVKGVQFPAGEQDIRIAVWGEKGGQNDLAWHTLSRNLDGNYLLDVKIRDHAELGIYNVHAYGFSKGGEMVLLGKTIFEVAGVPGFARVITSDIDGNKGTLKVTISGVWAAAGIQKVEMPMWCYDDQSDIAWYTALKTSDGIYTATMDVKNHRHHFGDYKIHVYVTMGNGIRVCVSSSTVQNISPSNYLYNEYISDTQRRVCILGVDGELVQFPTWSDTNGQDDIVWYEGTNNGNGTWSATVNSANHNNGGNYTTHAYITKNGVRVAVGSTTYSLTKIPTDQEMMRLRANSYSSTTGYIVLVNRTTHKVGVFQGWQGNWNCIQYWDCSDGKASTPTVEGVFRVGSRGHHFYSYGAICYWWTQFYGDYLFHSVLYNPNNGSLMDGRLGMGLSHGCVRLDINNAKWIYDTIPSGTTVVVYH